MLVMNMAFVATYSARLNMMNFVLKSNATNRQRTSLHNVEASPTHTHRHT
eukprot:m.356635 g.356635  ORF g.356635 m.356635 type:complete len:50 (+) comp17591_c0_seq1:2019-2168(+)